MTSKINTQHWTSKGKTSFLRREGGAGVVVLHQILGLLNKDHILTRDDMQQVKARKEAAMRAKEISLKRSHDSSSRRSYQTTSNGK